MSLSANGPRSVDSVPLGGRLRHTWTTYDVANWSLIVALTLVLVGIQHVAPHHRDIVSPSDPSINYPLVQEQVPLWLLLVLVVVLPVVAIIIIYLARRTTPHAKKELYHVSFAFAFSLLMTMLLTEFIKRIVGRPRPNFIALSGYQPDGTFTGTPAHVSNAFQSFPSGHTSTSFAGLGFLSLYLFRLCFIGRFPSRDAAQAYHSNQGPKTLLCLAPLLLATWIGLTRIVDYWHNYDDVAIGGVIGLTIAVLTFELHLNWWWNSARIAPDDSTPIAAVSSPRRNSGPSSSLQYALPMATNGRKQASSTSGLVPANLHDTDTMEAPLLETQV